MTFAYSVTPRGARDQILEVLREGGSNDWQADYERAKYLASHVMAACRAVPRRPAEVMEYIQSLAAYRADRRLPFEWTTPTGFPWSSTYFEQRIVLRGERFTHADFVVGHDPHRIRKQKSMNAAAPNVAHALDASHAIRTINDAVANGINNIALVHDSFACLAPGATRLHQILRSGRCALRAHPIPTCCE
jgi:DNA-directed RNA polymerase